MPSAGELQAELDLVFTTMKLLRADPDASQTMGGRTYTAKNLGELEKHYDWLEGKIATAAKAATAAATAGGGAGVAQFGGPTI